MPPILKESDRNAAARGVAPANPPAASASAESSLNRTQPVALEISVTVNGVRTAEGSNKREPFSETTKTVLVFSNGAVIRLGASIFPGQLLFLTNEKTKKEVVCQVVKSKNYRNVSGYVEVEFTEPAVGFWGMRFPGDRIAAAPTRSAPAPAKTIAPPALSAAPPKVELPVPPAILAPAPPDPPVAKPVELQVVKQDPVTPSSPDVSASILEPSQPPQKDWKPETDSLEDIKVHTARLQEELSSMVFSQTDARAKSEPEPRATAAVETGSIAKLAEKVVEISSPQPVSESEFEPAPESVPSLPATSVSISTPASTSSANDEETIKIPAWLEPLAKNTVAPASTQELIERAKNKSTAENSTPSAISPDPVLVPEAEETPALGFKVPSFGSLLPIDEMPETTGKRSGSSNKGILIAAVAAGICVLAAGGFWFWKQQSNSLHATAGAPAVDSAQVALQPALPSATQTNPINNLEGRSEPTEASPSKLPLHDASENAKTSASATPASSKVVEPSPASKQPRSVVPAKTEPEPEPVKPSLGEVHLAVPKVHRRQGSQQNTNGDPGLALSSDSPIAGNASMDGGLSGVGTSQPEAPATPLAVGGDVKAAKLRSSVPPVYPSLARNQHVSGAVKIDALIDANGRVTSMTVLSGPALLQQAAMDALRQWKYQPATLDGNPVPMHLTVTIQFRLQ